MRLPCLLLLLLSATAAAAQPSPVPVANPGFEATASANDPRPEEWWAANGTTPIVTDAGVAFEGQRSLRLDHRPPFVGSLQRIDAVPWRGRRVILRARLKGAGIGQGNVGLWLRGDDLEGRVTGFATSYAAPLQGDTGWELREARLFVGDKTHSLVFGAGLGAPGTLWVDSVELTAHRIDDLPPPSAAAREYLDEALALVEKNAYFAGRVDWAAMRKEAYAIAAGAKTTPDTHEAVRRVLLALGDGHSQFVPPEQGAQLASPQADSSIPGISATQVGRVGILRVPGFQSTNEARGEAFANALRGRLETQSGAGACGWIIDLRANTGGNMHPMIQGLSGLLGGETLGYFVGRHGRDAWTARKFGTLDVEVHVLPGGTAAPVAVLQGPRTASSGEATLLSFVGRENTRRFGEPSMGLSTANGVFPLGDGAMLALTTALMADRSGQVHGGRIAPDEAVQGEKATEMAALRWLEAQPGCADYETRSTHP